MCMHCDYRVMIQISIWVIKRSGMRISLMQGVVLKLVQGEWTGERVGNCAP